jgi:hypothetical protein
MVQFRGAFPCRNALHLASSRLALRLLCSSCDIAQAFPIVRVSMSVELHTHGTAPNGATAGDDTGRTTRIVNGGCRQNG